MLFSFHSISFNLIVSKSSKVILAISSPVFLDILLKSSFGPHLTVLLVCVALHCLLVNSLKTALYCWKYSIRFIATLTPDHRNWWTTRLFLLLIVQKQSSRVNSTLHFFFSCLAKMHSGPVVYKSANNCSTTCTLFKVITFIFLPVNNLCSLASCYRLIIHTSITIEWICSTNIQIQYSLLQSHPQSLDIYH